MNSIFKLITNQQIPETANALVPVIGYEPWSLRALESIVHCELVACGWMIETLPPTCCLSKCFLRRLRITINRKEKGAFMVVKGW